MSDLQTKFETAGQDAKQLPPRPDNDTLLKLYALYKQATQGNVSGKRPGFLDSVGRAKYDAWARAKEASQDEAMQSYVDLVGNVEGVTASRSERSPDRLRNGDRTETLTQKPSGTEPMLRPLEQIRPVALGDGPDYVSK